jgi:predicted glycosyltransferase
MAGINKKVLIAPLDWGLGHATRCIPVINACIETGCDVVITASGPGKTILQKRFPGITFIDLPGFPIRYPDKGSMVLSMLAQFPGFLSSIKKENLLLDKIIDDNQITHVISDNRYGLHSRKAKCAFITHQVHIDGGGLGRFAESILFRLNKFFIGKFNVLWIPDEYREDAISGKLSDKSGINIPVQYTGLLSRFTDSFSKPEKKYSFIALLSGPEPQRSLFEKKIILFFDHCKQKSLLVRGIPGEETLLQSRNSEIRNSVTDEYLQSVLHPETILISRPGYSTLMDMAVLQHSNLWLVPTPGQTEQAYLASRMQQLLNVRVIQQHEEFPAYYEQPVTTAFHYGNNSGLLKKVIREVIV